MQNDTYFFLASSNFEKDLNSSLFFGGCSTKYSCARATFPVSANLVHEDEYNKKTNPERGAHKNIEMNGKPREEEEERKRNKIK